MINFFNTLYTLQELGIHQGFGSKELSLLSRFSNKKQINKIYEKFPKLRKFLPFCESYRKDNKFFYALPAYVYDTYIYTGFLIDINQYDKTHNLNKRNYWQYNPFISLDLKPQEDWDFAKEAFKTKGTDAKDDDIWKIFLAGCARMDYYQDDTTEIQRRIKYAIVEYMLKRPQFFTTDDFIDNPILHKKYSKK